MNNAKVLFTLPWLMLNRMQYREGLLRIQCKPHCHAILEEKKKQTKEERHAEIMRAKYGALMLAHEASKDMEDSSQKKSKKT